MTVVHAHDLVAIATKVLLAAGAPRTAADVVAASLVEAELAGHEEYGVRRLVTYLQMISTGTMDPKAIPRLGGVRAAAAVVDGRSGFGELAARVAVEHVRRLARQYGVASATVGNCGDVGRLTGYVRTLAAEGAVGVAMCHPRPLAWAAPRAAGRPPLVAEIPAEAGLAFVIQLVGGLLGGAEPAGGTVIVAIDVAAFRPVDEFRRHAERLCALLAAAAAPTAVPGEAEAATRAARVRDGIPVDDKVWSELAALPGGPTHH
ncbi:Ldh family oxidoreductase [Phytohabitans sp. ZYX-F-186]|uniref:Ldh family oxidoreductase n=1 Tax=Phytohabitans maris TaxID=3071409 RepID=A0ABU0ZE37_9ACTN|nr:Ldh family oxidoreductase [Phytohabitans sp. ZYX-F-186]MDQ7905324.1 Ldh family oxidoreductase [Phytohabitans sp. ZYX-F-186]